MRMKAGTNFCGRQDFDIGDGFFVDLDCVIVPDLSIPMLRFNMPLQRCRMLKAYREGWDKSCFCYEISLGVGIDNRYVALFLNRSKPA